MRGAPLFLVVPFRTRTRALLVNRSPLLALFPLFSLVVRERSLFALRFAKKFKRERIANGKLEVGKPLSDMFRPILTISVYEYRERGREKSGILTEACFD